MKRILVLLAAFGLFAVACGNDSDGSSSGDDGATDQSTDESGTDDGPADEAVDGDDLRIVSLSATATEILFAIGAGDQVVAVDSQSNFPAEAPLTDLQAFEPSVEAIAGYEPDIVVLSFDPGDVVDGLGALDIETLMQGSAGSLDEMYAQIEQLGAATGHVGDAAELVAGISTRLDELFTSQPARETPISFFHEVDNTLYSLTSSSFVGEIYAGLGLENIADAADDGSGFPQLSAEFVIDADPDVIFLGDASYGESAETVAQRPGWDTMSAVQQNHIVALDADIASRWGPRVVELAETIVAAVEKIAEPADA